MSSPYSSPKIRRRQSKIAFRLTVFARVTSPLKYNTCPDWRGINLNQRHWMYLYLESFYFPWWITHNGCTIRWLDTYRAGNSKIPAPLLCVLSLELRLDAIHSLTECLTFLFDRLDTAKGFPKRETTTSCGPFCPKYALKGKVKKHWCMYTKWCLFSAYAIHWAFSYVRCLAVSRIRKGA